MTFILITILLLGDILFYTTLLDVVLSWFTLAWVNLRPAFLANIMNPIYSKIKKFIPTVFWPFEFTPLIFMLILTIIDWIIVAYNPEIIVYYKSLFNF
jgi:uncharacterized protein YggT (Ycf19 family)